MRKLVLSGLVVALPALACNPAGDRWNTGDKTIHFMAGAVGGIVISDLSGSRWTGFTVAAGASVAAELLDKQGGGVCSRKDALVGVAGAVLGAWGSKWVIAPQPGGALVAYSRAF